MIQYNSEYRTVNVVRYLSPLREGGSLPAIIEADDSFLYVLKFKGAGQGVKALIAEVIGAEFAKLLNLRIPELVFANLDEAFGRTEPDEEIQDLLKFSTGTNLALHYLSGAVTYDQVVNEPDELIASKIVWLDSYLMNVDRTVRNTNMLMWHNEIWLIDHGASLYFHHTWDNWSEQAVKPFVQIKDHVLLPYATKLSSVDDEMHELINDSIIEKIVANLPDSWLLEHSSELSPCEIRGVYADFLKLRLSSSSVFLNQAQNAR